MLPPENLTALPQGGPADDTALLAQVVAGESEALGRLYDRYGRLLFSAALRITGDRGSAEEVTQDAFMRLWRNAGRFDAARGSLLAWMLTITHRLAIDELRSRRGNSRRREVELADDTPPTQSLDEAALVQLRLDLAQALRELPLAQREAIELLYFGGLTRQELARHTGSPLPTVHTRVRLAMEKLRGLLLGNDPLRRPPIEKRVADR